jgi:hypothetical protein
LPDTPEGWAGVMAVIAVIAGGLRIAWTKLGLGPDYKQIAKAMAEEHAADNKMHRDALVSALQDVSHTVERVNKATTDNIRMALEMYGKDVGMIRDAQGRVERKLEALAGEVSDLRVQVASK